MHEYVEVPIKLNPELLSNFENQFKLALKNEQVDVIILKGNPRQFCIGMDLDYITTAYHPSFITQFCDILIMVKNSPKPVLAQVEGDVIAGGLALIAIADFVIACDTASFCAPESRFGLTPTIAMSCLLERITLVHLKSLVWSATAIPATKALDWGIIDKISSVETIEVDVRMMSIKLSQNPQYVIRESKRLLDWHTSFEKTLGIGAHLLRGRLSNEEAIKKMHDYLENIRLFNEEYADGYYEKN